MPRNSKKILLLTVKLLIAAALMAWLLLSAHWNDFVRTSDSKKSYSVVDASEAPERFVVRSGSLWWSETLEVSSDQLMPIAQAGSDKQYLRPGFLRSISRINLWLLVAAMGVSLAGMFVAASRWWMLLGVQGITVPWWEAVRLTFLGQFYSLVVPGTVGGDVVKAYYVTKHTHDAKAGAILSVFIDRVYGLTSLTLVAAIALAAALISGAGVWADPMFRSAATVMACVVGVVMIVMTLILSRTLRRVMHLQKLYSRLPFAKTIASFGEAAQVYRHRWKSLVRVGLIMLLAPGIWVAALALIGRSIDLPISWYSYFLYIPLIYIIGAVPLTPGGAGLIESLYLIFFATMANPSEILAFALLARLIPIAWGIPGMLVAITGPKLPKIQEMQHELGI